MRRIILLALLTTAPLALAACDGDSDDRPDQNIVVDDPDGPGDNVDECPRADGQPCK